MCVCLWVGGSRLAVLVCVSRWVSVDVCCCFKELEQLRLPRDEKCKECML